MNKESETNILTIGYSTRTSEEFIELLQNYAITLIIDVRTIPHSRYNPQFNKENLPDQLKHYGIKYIHLPEIGGLRHPKANSVNTALKNSSFRGYADYMQTKEFAEQLIKVITLAREKQLAIMCAEALPWRCHRSLISDALVARHIQVLHIINNENVIKHELSEMAKVEGNRVSYPLYNKEKKQRTLSDFKAS